MRLAACAWLRRWSNEGRAASWWVAIEGAAAELVAAGGIAARPPEPGAPAGRPADADALVVDSYELPSSEIEAARGELPVAAVIDGDDAPAGVIVLSYHLDAVERLPGRGGLLGPDFAPLDPRFAAARRPRGARRVLVTVGGGVAGRTVLATALEELGRPDRHHELFVATRERPASGAAGLGVGLGAFRVGRSRRMDGPCSDGGGGHVVRTRLRRRTRAPDGRGRQPTPSG